MNFDAIVNKIESLPSLSDAAILVQQLYADGAENVNIVKLVKVIESDALLALNILKMINAPYYGFSKKIASISQAVTLFGTQIIYGLVVSFAIQQQLPANMRPYGISNSAFNTICHLQSSLMMRWYSKVDLRHAQFLTPLALVMESGKLVLAREVAASSYLKEFKQGLSESEDISQFEDGVVGTSSYYISGLLFDHWNLEPLYTQMLFGLDYEHDYGEKLDYYIDSLNVIRTAINVKNILTEDSIEEGAQLVREMGLPVDAFVETANRMKIHYIQNK